MADGTPTARPQQGLELLKALWAAGEYRKALKLAASWPRLGVHKAVIERGWMATSRRQFTIELGRDPDITYVAGLLAVAERYGLPEPVVYLMDTPLDAATPDVCRAARGTAVRTLVPHDTDPPCRCYVVEGDLKA